MELMLWNQQQMISMPRLGVPPPDRVRPLVHRFQRPAVSMWTKTRILRLQVAVMQALTVEHTMHRLTKKYPRVDNRFGK